MTGARGERRTNRGERLADQKDVVAEVARHVHPAIQSDSHPDRLFEGIARAVTSAFDDLGDTLARDHFEHVVARRADDVDVAVSIGRDAEGVAQLRRLADAVTHDVDDRGDHASSGDLEGVVGARPTDVDIAGGIGRDPIGSDERVAGAVTAAIDDLSDDPARRDLEGIVAVGAGDVHVAAAINRDAVRFESGCPAPSPVVSMIWVMAPPGVTSKTFSLRRP